MAELAALGGLVSGIGSIIGGQQTQTEADFQAKQGDLVAGADATAFNEQATGEIASGVQASQEQQRQTGIVLSREQSIAAASGAGVSTPTVMNVMGNTAARGTQLAGLDVWKGETAANATNAKAAATIIGAQLQGQQLVAQGGMAAESGIFQGIGSMLSGGAKGYEAYAAGYG